MSQTDGSHRPNQSTVLDTGLPWTGLLGRAGKTPKGSQIRELLAVTARPDVISFAGGLPAPELFPVEEIRQAADEVLRADGAAALQYGPTEGWQPLRELVASRLSRRGIGCSAGQVLITTGSQQALDLLGEVFLAPGMNLLVESPSYVGALQAFSPHRPSFVPFPMDEEGLAVEAVARWLEAERAEGRLSKAAFLYTVATFQNPSGVTMSLDRRLRLLELTRTFSLPVVEDDPYSELSYGSSVPPPLRAFAGGEDVIYLGTFSKVLSPGLRVGYVVAPQPVIDRMVLAKQGRDLHTDGLSQRLVLEFCRRFDPDAHVARLRAAYRVRRDAMLDALRHHMPSGVEWTEPGGGMFLWVTLPEGLETAALLADAVERKVAFVPGAAFHVDGSGANTMRLNFTNSTPEEINQGVVRLADSVRSRLERLA
jgi:2-aminoadipate transaminase